MGVFTHIKDYPGRFMAWISSLKTIQVIKDYSAVAVSVSTLSLYGVYNYYYLVHGEKTSELFFIATCIAISYFSLISYPVFKRLSARTFSLFMSSFFLSLLYIYVRYWIVEGKPTTNYKWSLYAGLLIGTGHLIYCLIKNMKNRKHDGHSKR